MFRLVFYGRGIVVVSSVVLSFGSRSFDRLVVFGF